MNSCLIYFWLHDFQLESSVLLIALCGSVQFMFESNTKLFFFSFSLDVYFGLSFSTILA